MNPVYQPIFSALIETHFGEFQMEALAPEDHSFEFGALDEFQMKAELTQVREMQKNKQQRHRNSDWF